MCGKDGNQVDREVRRERDREYKVILVEDTTRFFFVPDKPYYEVEPSYFLPRKLHSAWQSDAVEEARRTYGSGTVLKAVATIERSE
ncbi:hypothetical protein HYW73_00755 [Candidatus Nomurabacteria bacterium]|nr:hypothetical protein [Candidatus Nomurabacteria bacterium]